MTLLKNRYVNSEKKQKAIIIAGEWNSSNLGDEIICKTFRYILQNLLQEDEICLIPLDISLCKWKLHEKSVYYFLRIIYRGFSERYYSHVKSKYVKLETKKLLNKYVVDKLIFSGGAIFQKYFCSCVYAVVIECARYSIPVFFHACGFGQNDKKSTSIFRFILSQPCIQSITTRDNLLDIALDDITVTPDVAILAYRYYDFIHYEKKEITIGLNIVSPYYYIKNSPDKITYKTFNEKMIGLIKKLSSTYKIIIFTNGGMLDYEYSRWLYNQTYHFGNIAIEDRPKNGFELIKIIYKHSLVIGFRLHSLITAYSYNVPTIGIVYDNKINYWGKMIGNNHIYLVSEISINSIDALCNELIEKGIDIDRKHEIEETIIEQIRTYITK